MSQPLAGRHLVLGVTGGVAAYKACDLLRRLQDAGASVQVVMTEAATRFVTPMTFQALSGRPVITDAWSPAVANHMPHIELSREADGVIIAPCTADFMALLATGQTPDLLSSLCLAREVPLWIAPAMNRQMWTHPATQANASRLAEQGVLLLGPSSGSQACGEVGQGRMLEPLEIVAGLVEGLVAHSAAPSRGSPVIRGLLHGCRVLLTAGPTQEPIDPVRVITNRSSGQMGYALAAAAAEAGAEVVMVSGPTRLPTPLGVHRVDVETALEMEAAVRDQLVAWGQTSPARAVLFMGVAAVADWRLASPLTEKIKKGQGAGLGQFEWIENPDILAGVGHLPQGQRPDLVLGFAAETGTPESLLAEMPAKLSRKSADLLVGNLATEALGQEAARVWLLRRGGEPKALTSRSKVFLAREIVLACSQLLADRSDAPTDSNS